MSARAYEKANSTEVPQHNDQLAGQARTYLSFVGEARPVEFGGIQDCLSNPAARQMVEAARMSKQR
jgi:hypothetical protein